ncbi:hypothetical protein GCM10008019_19810 [Deinococcus soli (ex Cha et al. 2016)]|nr:hypothetical protein GCM10008019_19810 [Deinococcus soli (ex Cha et al. 2016)]
MHQDTLPLHRLGPRAVVRAARGPSAVAKDGVEAGYVTAPRKVAASVKSLAERSDCPPVPPGDGGWGVGQPAAGAPL